MFHQFEGITVSLMLPDNPTPDVCNTFRATARAWLTMECGREGETWVNLHCHFKIASAACADEFRQLFGR